MDQPRVAVIIVNYNGSEVLRDCLKSVLGSTYTELDILVVDNASTDDSLAMVRRDFPSVHLIACSENLGFAGGNNVGIRVAAQAAAEYVFILNNDTIIAPDCIEWLVRRARADSRIGAVSPMILFSEPKDRIWAAGGEYDLWRGVARHAGLRCRMTEKRWNQPRKITFATGCAVLISVNALQEVGSFDERLFMYNEDSDLSLRLRKAGWILYYEPRAAVWHREAWTTSRTIGKKWGIRLCVRNILHVHKKHACWYHKLTFFPYFVWRWILLSGGNALVHGKWDVVQGIREGIAAYRQGEFGRPQ